MIAVKTQAQIDVMVENGRLLSHILASLRAEIRPGQTTARFDRLAEEIMVAEGAEPAFKGYEGYPATINASLNDEVVHGIPSVDRTLREGDLFSIDIGLVRDGMYVDMATTVAIGEVGEEARRLLEIGESSLWRGIKQVRIGNRLSDISHAIGSFVEAEGFHVVKEYVGHGIGEALHEDPQIPNFGPPGHGVRLAPGMAFAIEPMVKFDPLPTRIREDQWTVVTGSGGLSVHFEHTVVLTDGGVVVVTLGGDEGRSGDE
ncbi:type I methionyl aminopeptidase [Candidatus Bipolaricaulota bacterium]